MNKPLLIIAAFAFLLTGCSSDDGNTEALPTSTAAPPPPQESVTFEVSIRNVTNSQPLSPLAVIVHKGTYSVFTLGETASLELEMLAESGDPSALLSAADSDARVLGTQVGSGIIMPGMAETVTITATGRPPLDLRISVLTMPVNTNDAFTGVNSLDLNDLATGESILLSGIVYDAGTEANTEAASDVPGPAAGGEGFNATRDDILNLVTIHGGVVTRDDGLATSALTNQHRFLNPVALFTIMRK